MREALFLLLAAASALVISKYLKASQKERALRGLRKDLDGIKRDTEKYLPHESIVI